MISLVGAKVKRKLEGVLFARLSGRCCDLVSNYSVA